MTPTIAEWRDTLLDVGSIRFPRTVEASGAFTTLIGSRPAYAKVVLKFEPATEFQVDASAIGTDPRTLSYAHSIVLGALDVLMTAHAYAISQVKISIIGIDEDEVTSTPRAFRLASRDAARKAMAEVSGATV